MKSNSNKKIVVDQCYADPESIMVFYENISKQIKQYEEENGALTQRINSLNSTDQNYFPNIIPIKKIPVSEEVWEKCKSWDSFWNMCIIDRYKSADEYDRGISYGFIQQHFNSTSKFSPLGILSLWDLSISDES